MSVHITNSFSTAYEHKKLDTDEEKYVALYCLYVYTRADNGFSEFPAYSDIREEKFTSVR